jgi:hypothetical protein
VTACAAALVMACLVAPVGRADNFRSVSYDAATDELVMVVAYRGTNPDHEFSVNWGQCIVHDDGGRVIEGELLDQQFEDEARKEFTTTVRISLASLDCRPAALTIRTAPRFYYSLQIPARAQDAGR